MCVCVCEGGVILVVNCMKIQLKVQNVSIFQRCLLGQIGVFARSVLDPRPYGGHQCFGVFTAFFLKTISK